MHRYLVVASVLLPLIGIWQMEDGAYGRSIGVHGYPNGATIAFGVYAIILLVTFLLVDAPLRHSSQAAPADGDKRFRSFSVATLGFILLPSLAIMLFYFEAWRIWMGISAKGQFRVNLGPFGAFAYMLVNAIVPMCIAYAAVLYRRSSGGWLNVGMIGVLFAMTVVIGSTWGFKSTGITMLVPAMLILFWHASVWWIGVVAVACAALVIGFFTLFDSQTTEAAAGLGFLWTRLTILQGDVAWEIWDQYSNGVPFPSYASTLWAFAGAKVLAIFTGVTRDMPDAWASYNFDVVLMQQVGLPLTVLQEGHSIVGTPFADGLMMGGMMGVVSMALFCGLMAGLLCRIIAWSLDSPYVWLCAATSTYFGILAFTFLRNGVMIQLFHLSNLLGLVVAIVLCVVVSLIAEAISVRWCATDGLEKGNHRDMRIS